jgi:hypothetical protein
MSAEKSYTDALADFPARNSLAQGVDFAHHFMAGDARERDAGEDAIDRS